METSGKRQQFTFQTDASDAATRQVLGQIRSDLSRLGVPDQTCGTVELILAEVLNNIVEHAYAPDAPGPVKITVDMGPPLHFTLVDRGNPLPGSALPQGKLPDRSGPLDDLPEGGFGWFLIRNLTTALDYRREGVENRLSFTIPQNSGDC